MKTSQHTVNQLGLQTIKTLVLFMVFAGLSFLLANSSVNSVEKSFEQYDENAEILNILHN